MVEVLEVFSEKEKKHMNHEIKTSYRNKQTLTEALKYFEAGHTWKETARWLTSQGFCGKGGRKVFGVPLSQAVCRLKYNENAFPVNGRPVISGGKKVAAEKSIERARRVAVVRRQQRAISQSNSFVAQLLTMDNLTVDQKTSLIETYFASSNKA